MIDCRQITYLEIRRMRHSRFEKFHAFAALVFTALLPSGLHAQQTITGQAAFADWNQQQPGVRRKITVADLPVPKPQEAVNNTPHLIPRPKEAWPIAPPGFKVTLYAGGDVAPMQRADNKEHMQLSGAHLRCLACSGRHPMAISFSLTPAPAPSSSFAV
jgi:hypothetical protein